MTLIRNSKIFLLLLLLIIPVFLFRIATVKSEPLPPAVYTPYFPIGIYHVFPRYFSDVTNNGIDTVHLGGWQEPTVEELDLAHKNNLKVIPLWYHNGRLDKIREVVSRIKNHPALLAWYLVDEPAEKDIEIYRDAYNYIKKADPIHPVFTVSYVWSLPYLKRIAEISDIIAVDPYIINEGMPENDPETDISLIGQAIYNARKASAFTKPVWAVIQAHEYRPKDGKFPLRFPTPGELRGMVYTAVVHGAAGIIYFSYDSPATREGYVKGANANKELWDAIKNLNMELKQLLPVITSPESRVNYSVHYDGKNAFTNTIMKQYKDRLFLFAVNSQNSPKDITVQLSGVTIDENVEVLFEGRKVRLVNSGFKDIVKGLGVHIYSFKKRVRSGRMQQMSYDQPADEVSDAQRLMTTYFTSNITSKEATGG